MDDMKTKLTDWKDRLKDRHMLTLRSICNNTFDCSCGTWNLYL